MARFLCNKQSASLALIALGVLSLQSTPVLAVTDADFSAYCRANYSNSAYQRFAHSWGTEHACVRGGTRQGIDFAQACEMTTGNRSFEVSGTRILCEGDAAGATSEPTNSTPASEEEDQPVGQPDFARYCRTKYSNSMYLKRHQSWGTEHLCRQPGQTTGYVLHNIDLEEACRQSHNVSDYRINGPDVTCVKKAATDVAAKPDPGPGPDPKPDPDPNPNPDPKPNPNPDPNPEPDPNPDNAAATKDKAFAEVKAACQNPDNNRSFIGLSSKNYAFSPKPIILDGDWKRASVETVEPYFQHFLQTMRERKNGESWRFGQVSGVYKATAYWAVIGVLNCDMAVVRNGKYFSSDDFNTAKLAACGVRKILGQILNENAVLNSGIWADWHALLTEVQQTKNLCVATVPPKQSGQAEGSFIVLNKPDITPPGVPGKPELIEVSQSTLAQMSLLEFRNFVKTALGRNPPTQIIGFTKQMSETLLTSAAEKPRLIRNLIRKMQKHPYKSGMNQSDLEGLKTRRQNALKEVYKKLIAEAEGYSRAAKVLEAKYKERAENNSSLFNTPNAVMTQLSRAVKEEKARAADIKWHAARIKFWIDKPFEGVYQKQ